MKAHTKLLSLIESTSDTNTLIQILMENDCLSESATQNLNAVREEFEYKRKSYRDQVSKLSNNSSEYVGDGGGNYSEFASIEQSLLLKGWLSPKGLEVYDTMSNPGPSTLTKTNSAWKRLAATLLSMFRN